MLNRRLRNKISQSTADHRSQLWYRSRSRGPPGWTGHQTGSGGHWRSPSPTLSSRHSKLPKMGMGSSWRKRPGVSRSLYEGTLHFSPDWYRRRTGDYVSKINFEFHVLNVEAFGLINRILELGLTVRYFIYIF